MDFEDMEKKIVANHSHRTILPHNPQAGSGRCWGFHGEAIFQRHGVYVISDEIWSDIIRPGREAHPTQMVNSYAKGAHSGLYAPSKTFNLAGLIGSYHHPASGSEIGG